MTEAARPMPPPARLAAALVGCTALLEAVLVTHHPVVGQAEHDSGIPFGGLAAIMQTNLTFHAVLMLIVVGQLLGLLLLARRLGLNRPLVLVGTIFCSVAAALLVIAMTFDGFVVYELISRCSASAAGCTAATGDGLRLMAAVIQGFTKLGFGAQCLGFIAFGIASWSLGGKARIGAVASVVAAAAPFAILMSGDYVGPEQLTHILALLAGWGLCMAAMLAAESFKLSGKSAGAAPAAKADRPS